jgi:hypothetical protein
MSGDKDIVSERSERKVCARKYDWKVGRKGKGNEESGRRKEGMK